MRLPPVVTGTVSPAEMSGVPEALPRLVSRTSPDGAENDSSSRYGLPPQKASRDSSRYPSAPSCPVISDSAVMSDRRTSVSSPSDMSDMRTLEDMTSSRNP